MYKMYARICCIRCICVYIYMYICDNIRFNMDIKMNEQ